jgi:hypothetical protein
MRDQLLALLVVIGAALLGWMVLHDQRGKRRSRASGHEGGRVAMGVAGSTGMAIREITAVAAMPAAVTAAEEGTAGAMAVEAGTEESCALNEGRLICLNAAF